MSDKHYNLEEALENKVKGIWGQTYDLTIVSVGETIEFTRRDGTGKGKRQNLYVTDGTAEIKFTVWDPDQFFEKDMGLHVEEAYIKENDGGYTDLRVKKDGGVVTFSATSEVTIQAKKEKKEVVLISTEEVMDVLIRIEANIEKILEQKGE